MREPCRGLYLPGMYEGGCVKVRGRRSSTEELDTVNLKRERTLLLVIRDETDTHDVTQPTKVHCVTSGLTDNVLLELAEVQRDFFPCVDALR